MQEQPKSQLQHDLEKTNGQGFGRIVSINVLERIGTPVPKPDYLIKDLLPRRKLAMMVGDSGIGKTTILSTLSADIMAMSSKFMDRITLFPRHRNVLFLSSEDDIDKFHGILDNTLRKKYPGKSLEDLRNELLPIRFSFIDLSAYKNLETFFVDLRDEIKSVKYDLVVIDTFGDLMAIDGIDINDNTMCRQVLNELQNIVQSNDFAMILMHHNAKTHTLSRIKGNEKKTVPSFFDKFEVMGASSIVQKVRLVLAYSYDKYSSYQVRVPDDSDDGYSYIQNFQSYLYAIKANSIPQRYQRNAIVINNYGEIGVPKFCTMAEMARFEDEDANTFAENIRRQLDGYTEYKYGNKDEIIEPQKTQTELDFEKIVSYVGKDELSKGIQVKDLIDEIMKVLGVKERKAEQMIADFKKENLLIKDKYLLYLAGSSINSMSSSESINAFENPLKDGELGF